MISFMHVVSAFSGATGSGSVNTETPELHDSETGAMTDTQAAPMTEAIAVPVYTHSPCKYRWAKTIPVHSDTVTLQSSNQKTGGVVLTWNEASQAYYSSELKLQCGDYRGAITIEDQSYPVEDYSVRNYTFEVDLYVRDDLIEDDVGVNQIEEKEIKMQEEQIQTNGIDTYRDLNSALVGSDKMEKTDPGLQLSSKYTDLVRQQMSNSDKNEALDAVFASGDARRTPVFSDHSAHSSQQHTPVPGITDDVRRTPIFSDQSAHSSNRHTPISYDMQEPVRVEDVSRVSMNSEQFLGQPLQREDLAMPGRITPTSSGRSPHSSARQTPQPELIEDILLGEASAAQDSLAAQESQVPGAELIDDVLERVSEHSIHSSARQMPVVMDDALQKSWSSATSSSSSSRTPSSRPSSSQSSTSSSSHPASQRDLISDAYRVSRERLTNRQDRRSSGSSSKTSSASGSRPPSITSEQELSQYFDQDKGHRTGTTLPIIPVLAEQQSSRLISEPYQKTYSNRPSSSTSSKSSSRTITPVMTNGLQNGHRADDHIRQEMEGTIAQLKMVIHGRESEGRQMASQMEDLKDINQSLQEELRHVRARSPAARVSNATVEMERRYNQIIGEKEILTSEIVKLRDELEETRQRNRDGNSSINSYRPDNPTALQRKIADLESHVLDLQEVNESAVTKLSQAETTIQDMLDSGVGSSGTELKEQNRHLQEQVRKLQEFHQSSSSKDPDYRMRVEVQQLRDDMQAMRERNYKLNEENIQLKESKLMPRHADVSPPRTERLPGEPTILPMEAKQYHSIPPSYEAQSNPHKSLPNTFDTRISVYPPNASQRDPLGYNLKPDAYGQRDPLGYNLKPDAYDRSYLDKYGMENESRHRSSSAERLLKCSTSEKQTLDAGLYVRGIERSKSERNISESMKRYLSDPYSPERPRNDIKPYSDKYGDYSHVPHPPARPKDYNDFDYRAHPPMSESRASTLNTSGSSLYRWDAEHSKHSQSETSETVRTDTVTNITSDMTQRSKIVTDRENYYPAQHRVVPDVGRSGYTEDDELSDTATDILISAEPSVKWSPRNAVPLRRLSISSTESDGYIGDEETYRSTARRRTKSMDNRVRGQHNDKLSLNLAMASPVSRGRSRTPERLMTRVMTNSVSHGRSTTPERMKQPRSTPTSPSSGFRSITPRPILTQHNKGSGPSLSRSVSLTHGMRPFSPRNPVDLQPGDVVKFSRQGGKISAGYVKFVGHLPGRCDIYIGVELEHGEGKHDGTFEKIRYFKSKPNKGVFVAFNKIVMAWVPA